ncbi:MAG: hypothetical protein R3E96_17415, partial [Planctomycetota bacterium]
MQLSILPTLCSLPLSIAALAQHVNPCDAAIVTSTSTALPPARDEQPDAALASLHWSAPVDQTETRWTPAPPMAPEPQCAPGVDLPTVSFSSSEWQPIGVFQDRIGDTWWATGETYKASAGPRGFEYHPFLGSDAPQNYPVSFALVRASFGGEVLPLAANAEVRREADRWVLDRGPVETWYDLEPRAVEQSFALMAAGRTEDLRLELAVSSELDLSLDSEGLTWSNERGGVHYRKAVVLDGSGRRMHLPIQAAEGRVQLTVPAEFLAHAVDPIIVDPILSTFTVYSNTTYDQHAGDVAYDFSSGRWGYLLLRDFSIGDRDIRMVGIDANGALTGSTWVEISSEFWDEGVVAIDGTSDTFLVVATRRVTGGAEVQGRTVHGPSYALSPSFLIGNISGTWTNLAPDVCANLSGPSNCKVVWERYFSTSGNRAIRAVNVTLPAVHSITVPPTVGGLELVTSDSNIDYYSPRVSDSTSSLANQQGRLVFLGYEASSGAYTRTGFGFDEFGTTVAGTTYLETFAAGIEPISLDVTDLETRTNAAAIPYHGVVMSYVESASGRKGIGLTLKNNTQTTDSVFLPTMENVWNTGDDFLNANVVGTGYGFVVSYAQQSPGSSMQEVYATTLRVDNNGDLSLSEPRVHLGTTTGLLPRQPVAASQRSGGYPTSPVMALGYDSDDQGLVRTTGVLLSTVFLDVAGNQYCYGTMNSTGEGGLMLVGGGPDANSSKTLFAENLPLNQFGYFLTSQGGSGIVMIGGGNYCLNGGPVGRYNQNSEIFFTGTEGRGELTILPFQYRTPTGDVSALAGQTWNFQAWHRENGGQSNFTNAVT